MDRFPLREEQRLFCPAESPLLTHMWQVVARDWSFFFQWIGVLVSDLSQVLFVMAEIETGGREILRAP